MARPTAPTALDLATAYVAAAAARDGERLHALRSDHCITDWVHRDTVQAQPLPPTAAKDLFQSFFTAFPDLDFEVTRTILADEVVAMEWIFTGANTGPLEPPAFANVASREPTGRTVRLRGAIFLDIGGGLIERETVYFDQASLLVELGVGL